MPKNLQMELTAKKADQDEASTVAASANPVVPTKSYALAGTAGRAATAAKPSFVRRWGLWIGLAAAAIGGWLLYAQPWQPAAPGVAVELVAPGPITRVLAVNGRVAARRSVAVTSTIAGTLTASLAEAGDVVEQGAVLARLDDTSQLAAVRQAVSALDQGLVTQTQTEDALDRATALGETVSRVTLEDARSAAQRANQEVGRLRALLDQAQFQLSKFKITAPIAGTVLTRGIEPGEVVDLSTPLFTLADLSELVVETDVDESYATQIRQGMPALLQLTGDTQTLDGTVSFIAPVVDADTGGIAVKIAFNEPLVAPVGLTVTANIIVDRQDSAISVPRTAIATSEAGEGVFVLNDSTAKLVPISVLEWPAERLIVTDGLQPGDQLIVDADELVDGQRVTVGKQ